MVFTYAREEYPATGPVRVEIRRGPAECHDAYEGPAGEGRLDSGAAELGEEDCQVGERVGYAGGSVE